jgi:hypothetical protein
VGPEDLGERRADLVVVELDVGPGRDRPDRRQLDGVDGQDRRRPRIGAGEARGRRDHRERQPRRELPGRGLGRRQPPRQIGGDELEGGEAGRRHSDRVGRRLAAEDGVSGQAGAVAGAMERHGSGRPSDAVDRHPQAQLGVIADDGAPRHRTDADP